MTDSSQVRRRRRSGIVWLILALGLVARVTVAIPYRELEQREIDERLYVALVQQLDSGKGYTLQGHPILTAPWIVKPQYDHPLFYHPPGGPVWFWGFAHLFGDNGWALAQMFAWALFYFSTLSMVRQLVGRLPQSRWLMVCLLAAFTPIVAHVTTHFWLDGPQVGLVAAAAAAFVAAARRQSHWFAILSGILLAAACWLKLHALLALPGILLLGWAVRSSTSWRQLVGLAATTALLAGLLAMPWLIWQWLAVGSPFPAWAGKPHPDLIATNRYVHHVTVVRPWWVYFVVAPMTVSSLVGSFVLFVQRPPKRRRARIALALTIWIGTVVGVLTLLGAIGYAKLLRHVILLSPAAVALFAVAVARRGRIPGPVWLLAAVEVFQGLVALFVNYRLDGIEPLIPGPWR